MTQWSIEVGGVRVTPYLQLYAVPDGSECHGELLSRPAGVEHVEEFFSGLTYEQHVEVLRWQLALKEELSRSTHCELSVNVHNCLVSSAERQAYFLGLLAEFPTPTTFEFTETHPMPPVAESNLLLRRVRELGHRSALDDFGAGLNGMSLLTDYDFDVVKLDRSLVYDIDARLEKRKTVALIGQMLGVLGKGHVVEGVETPETREILMDSGFATFQGYGIHMPEPLEIAADRILGEVPA